MNNEDTLSAQTKRKIQKKIIFKGFLFNLLAVLFLFVMGGSIGYFSVLWGGNIADIGKLMENSIIVSFMSLVITILMGGLAGYYVARKAEYNKIKHAYYLGFINLMLGVLVYSVMYAYIIVTDTYYEPTTITIINMLYIATYIPASVYGAKVATQTQNTYA